MGELRAMEEKVTVIEDQVRTLFPIRRRMNEMETIGGGGGPRRVERADEGMKISRNTKDSLRKDLRAVMRIRNCLWHLGSRRHVYTRS